jgi:aminopeptidase-like protein
MMWLLNFSDGTHDLLAIAERSGLSIELLWQAAKAAEEKGLIERCTLSKAESLAR